MKITALILLTACLHVSAHTDGQTVTYDGTNVPLQMVFKAIEQQTGCVVFCNYDLLKNSKPLSVKATDMQLDEFLEIVLKDQGLEFSKEDKTIVITRKSVTPHLSVGLDNNPITGIIRGPDGQPLTNVSITIKGTKHGTITDNEGRFKIAADEGSVLQITAIGFGYKEFKVNASQNLTITLEIATSVLDEVQYIAYGTTSKRLSTGNIGSVKAADIEKQPVQNVLLALQGRVPGLFVTQVSGLSGAGIKVRIHGQNSIFSGNNPLYVIDGVPIDADLPSTRVNGGLSYPGPNYIPGGNPLNYLNPLDIESVEVLKDADATAIYGSRAASGAILITTKKGKVGAMKLDLNMQSGWGKMTRRVDMMNTRQYLDMRYEAFRNDNIDWRGPNVSANDLKVWDTTSYTNWQDQLLGGTSHYNDINASVSGGSPTMRYLVSGTYHKEGTVFPFPEFTDQRGAVHFNLNANNSNQKLKMQFSGNFMFDDNRLPSFDLTQSALLLEPNAPPLLNADGSINWAPDASGNTTLGQEDVNVMIYRLRKYENKTYNLISSLKLDYTILPGLTVGSNFGYNYMQTNDFLPFPIAVFTPEQRATAQRSAMFGDRKIYGWIVEPQTNYRTKLSKGTLDVIAGGSFQERSAKTNTLNASGQLSDDLLDNITSAAKIDRPTGDISMYKYTAVFSRVNYNWSDKYIVNINARVDGSSRFGANNRFHAFGSIGGAWIFSGERFFRTYLNVLSFGKLRGSYGTTGSDQIDDYRFMSLYEQSTLASLPYQEIVGLSPTSLPNPELQWEETRKLTVGVDLGFFQDKLLVATTFTRNRSSNQLLYYKLPAQTGFANYLVNFPATVQNKNWEVVLTGKLIQQNNFVWISSINLTLPQNKLIAFPNLSSSSYSKTLRIGEPIDISAYYHWLGVAPGTGDNLYADKKGNPTLTPDPTEDGTALISQFPKLYGGIDNTLSYKGFQLNFIFQFVQQTGDNWVTFFNGNRIPGIFTPARSNQPQTVLDRWQNPGDENAVVARYSTVDKQSSNLMSSDRRFAGIWYVRLKNVAISFDLPEEWLTKAHFKSLRVNLHAQNLHTFTNYKGLDPETQSLSALPPLQVTTIGIQLGL